MSTFNGIVHEFPDIRIDNFRRVVGASSPLACFLSHVHSDHLAGLESLKSPFVYCSGATREILLRLERYPCRINYAKGLLEVRTQTYKHLSKLLKPLPLDTPTSIELQPGCMIQVTLLDANHCPGAVMFLIEDDRSAILYTGDIRSEPWFVNSLSRNPLLIAYTSNLQKLDKIYLDTSFTTNIPFQTKAEGLAELISKVSEYPQDTVFHVQAWTYGYEDVWIALSKALKSPIHVDAYKMRIYESLRKTSPDNMFASDHHLTHEAPALVGFMCGNSRHPGCLTSDTSVRLHSCEKGNMCQVAQQPSVVSIQPIVAHISATEDLTEVGVGGGADDLTREAEIESLSAEDMGVLLERFASSAEIPRLALEELRKRLETSARTGRQFALDLNISAFGDDFATSLQQAMEIFVSKQGSNADLPVNKLAQLPKVIRFPYSRHSSYPELCEFVNLFKPKDVWPCTVDTAAWLRDGTTIRSLFGYYCSDSVHLHDRMMEEIAGEQGDGGDSQAVESQMMPSSGLRRDSSPILPPISHDEDQQRSFRGVNMNATPEGLRSTRPLSPRFISRLPESQPQQPAGVQIPTIDLTLQESSEESQNDFETAPGSQTKRMLDDIQEEGVETGDSQLTTASFASTLSERHSTVRQEAFRRMLGRAEDESAFRIPLISTDDNHSMIEPELGLIHQVPVDDNHSLVEPELGS